MPKKPPERGRPHAKVQRLTSLHVRMDAAFHKALAQYATDVGLPQLATAARQIIYERLKERGLL